MSLNELLSTTYKPWLNTQENSIVLQKASSQLGFRPLGAGNTLYLSASNPATDGTVVNIPDSGVASSSVVLSVSPVSSLTATRALTSADSGKTLVISSAVAASGYALPAPTVSGLKFQFIVTGTIANPVTITSTGANIQGAISTNNGTAFATTGILVASTNVILTASTVGDNFIFISDGSKYWVQGQIAINTTVTRS